MAANTREFKEARRRLIQVAALAVASIESMDRMWGYKYQESTSNVDYEEQAP